MGSETKRRRAAYNPISGIKRRLIERLHHEIRVRAIKSGEYKWTVDVMSLFSGLTEAEIMWLFDTSIKDTAGPFLFHRPTRIVFYEPWNMKGHQ